MIKVHDWCDFWNQNALHEDPIIANDFPTISTAKYRRMCVEVSRLLKLEESDNLLNIGCGAGQFEKFVNNRIRSVIGLDFSLNMIQKAKSLNGNRRACFVQGDCTKLPFVDESFSKILAFSMTHYLTGDQLREMLHEAVRVLKPGGLFLIGDIQEPSFENLSFGNKLRKIYRQEGLKMLLIRFCLKMFDPLLKYRAKKKVQRLVNHGSYCNIQKPKELACFFDYEILESLPNHYGSATVVPQDSIRFYPKRYNILLTKMNNAGRIWELQG